MMTSVFFPRSDMLHAATLLPMSLPPHLPPGASHLLVTLIYTKSVQASLMARFTSNLTGKPENFIHIPVLIGKSMFLTWAVSSQNAVAVIFFP